MNKIIPLINLKNPDYRDTIPLTSENVAQDHVFNYDFRKMDFSKNLNLKGKFCYHPFNTITIDGNGDVFMCICQAWLPISVGKIWEFDSFEELVASSKVRNIQSSIIDGSYRYCDNNSCSIIQEDTLSNRIDHKPDTINWINFAIDSSCNLTCPSCRKNFTFINEGLEFHFRIKIVDHIVKMLANHKHYIKFSLAGDGDPFASLIYRHLLENLQLIQSSEIEIITNGILLKNHWHKLNKIWFNIVRTKISFDAGTEETYNKVRCGGSWDKLLDSTEFLVKWKSKNYSNMAITTNFVVQTSNYKEIPEYIELCNRLNVDEINLQKIDNWNTFDNFNDHAIWQTQHPEHGNFLEILKHKNLNNKKVNLTNLSYLYETI